MMATSWFTTAVHVYLTEGRSSLLECYDEVVASCLQEIARTSLDNDGEI